MPDDRLARARVGYEGYVYQPPRPLTVAHLLTACELDVSAATDALTRFVEERRITCAELEHWNTIEPDDN